MAYTDYEMLARSHPIRPPILTRGDDPGPDALSTNEPEGQVDAFLGASRPFLFVVRLVGDDM